MAEPTLEDVADLAADALEATEELPPEPPADDAPVEEAEVVDQEPEPAATVAPDDEGKDPQKMEVTDEAHARYPEDVWRAMTVADERQIAAEMQGRAVTTMVYSFRQGNTTVTGLSWKGIREAVRQMNTRKMGLIRIAKDVQPIIEQVEVEEDGEMVPAIRATVYAEDAAYGSGQWGSATQPMRMKLSRGGYRDDIFAASKALSKAQRNALEPLIPLELVEEIKELYLHGDKAKVEYIASTAEEVDPGPPPLTTPEAEALKEKARAVYQQIRKKHGLAHVTPAQFNRMMMKAEHSLDRLGDLIEALEHLRDREVEK